MRELFRSTPFRITAVLGSAFFVAVLIAGFIAYSLIENELAQRMDQTITDTFKVVGQDTDAEDLVCFFVCFGVCFVFVLCFFFFVFCFVLFFLFYL